MEQWTKEQLENFFRHETMKSDEQCKKLASALHKNNLIDLLLKTKPSEYTQRME